MKKFFKKIQTSPRVKKRAGENWPPLDVEAQIAIIKSIEADQDIGLGKRIHQFSFREFELRLDRDVTGTYRLVANEGNERRYSFSIRCKKGNYQVLLTSFQEIINYLSGDRRFANLPNHEQLKGHYYGP